jgi:hypothetical protein
VQVLGALAILLDADFVICNASFMTSDAVSVLALHVLDRQHAGQNALESVRPVLLLLRSNWH